MKRSLVNAPGRVTDWCLDRFFVVLGALGGAQIPGFIGHYRQRLGGRLDEATVNVQQWQQNADIHYQGSLDALVNDYLSHNDPSIVQTGDKIAADLYRYEDLHAAWTALDTPAFWRQPVALFEHFDPEIFWATWGDYVFNLPADPAGLVYAGVGAILGAVAYQGGKGTAKQSAKGVVRLARNRSSKGPPSRNHKTRSA